MHANFRAFSCMICEMEDRRKKLTDDARAQIHKRFYARPKSGETLKAIGEDFGIGAQHVKAVALAVEAQRGKR